MEDKARHGLGINVPRGTCRTVAVIYWSVVLPGVAIWWPDGAPEEVSKGVLLAGLLLNALGLGRAAVGALGAKKVVSMLVLSVTMAMSASCTKKTIVPAPDLAPQTPIRAVESQPTPTPSMVPQEWPQPTETVRRCQTVHFGLDRADLSETARLELDALVVAPDASVILVGACCPLGTDEYNLALGLRRAEAVRGYLLDRGTSDLQITVQSVGESDLVTAIPAEYWRNRRCEVVVE